VLNTSMGHVSRNMVAESMYRSRWTCAIGVFNCHNGGKASLDVDLIWFTLRVGQGSVL
jgi:hypothetical protein